jgi:hypothetical protein
MLFQQQVAQVVDLVERELVLARLEHQALVIMVVEVLWAQAVGVLVLRELMDRDL